MQKLVLLAAASLGLSATAAEPLAPPDVVAQFQAMNDADCASSKAGNFDAYVRTLAPDYVQVTADGAHASRAEIVADHARHRADDQVTACSTLRAARPCA